MNEKKKRKKKEKEYPAFNGGIVDGDKSSGMDDAVAITGDGFFGEYGR